MESRDLYREEKILKMLGTVFILAGLAMLPVSLYYAADKIFSTVLAMVCMAIGTVAYFPLPTVAVTITALLCLVSFVLVILLEVAKLQHQEPYNNSYVTQMS